MTILVSDFSVQNTFLGCLNLHLYLHYSVFYVCYCMCHPPKSFKDCRRVETDRGMITLLIQQV